MASFIEKIIHQISEPFSSWETFWSTLTAIVTNVTDVRSKTGWPWLLTSLVIAYLVYWVGKRRGHVAQSKSFTEVTFPKEIYSHRSSIVDFKFVALDQLIRGLVYVPVVGGISYFLYVVLSDWFGTTSWQMSPTVALWFVPFYAVLVVDFGNYLGHRLLHEVPFLWPFHEVHHSAEVLSPVTVFRVHPVETMIQGVVHAFLNALTAAVFTSITDIKVDPFQMLGLNVVTFLYYAIGFQLRHSHVWISYGPVLDRIFSSPAQHQIHHSAARHHWNKNYGLIFAFWDVLLGTVCLPKEREELQFGTGDHVDPADFGSVSKLYFLPFRKSYQALKVMLRLAPPTRRGPFRVPVPSPPRRSPSFPESGPESAVATISDISTA